MNLKKVYIDGFKNINEVEVELDKITALLSPNNFGKSNLLRAIDFGFEFMRATKEDKAKMMGWKNGFPLNSELEKDNFVFEIELENEYRGKVFSVIYSYAFEWRKTQKHDNGIIKENLKIRNFDESQKHSTYIQRNKSSKLYRASQTGRCDKKIIASKDLLIINKLLAFDDLFYLNEAIKPLNKITFYLDRHFDSTPSYEISPIVQRGADDLSLNSNSDIARVLFSLQNNYKNKFDLIVNTLKSMFSFIESIEIKEHVLSPEQFRSNIDDDAPFEIADKIYTLFAKHTNLKIPINFSEMSDGVRRVLLLLTHIVLAEINNVILIGIEEPENSINPGLLKKYIIALDNFIDTSKIIITSHSPFLVNYINPNSLYLGIPNQTGIANFKRIKKTSVNKIYDEADDLDMPFGEYLFDLLSGTEEEYQVLSRYF